MLSITDLYMNFGEADVLCGINLELAQGELFALLGPSGSGKSTVLRSVAGLETPTGGDITINGRTVFSRTRGIDIPVEKRQLGMVFQSYALWPHLTVRENVELPLRTGERKLNPAQVRDRVAEALHSVELEEFADRPVPRLSGGQQQRVALARALATKPYVMLMDEPLCNLDARLRETIREKIKNIVKDAGITVLYVTHDQAEAMAIADRIAVMANGVVRQVGTPREIYTRPVHPRIASFLGDVNWIEGTIQQNTFKTDFGELAVPALLASGPATAGIRPESLRLHGSPVETENAFPCQVASVTYLGSNQMVRIRLGSTEAVARVDGSARLADTMWVTIDPAEVLVFPGAVDSRPSSWLE